ncbi:unnamed protein product [Meganyctiphanes norvegica]|uniref:Uncharacterized protein n=1 Tax=Meganyctiphanes norvegica TaxID=48144 RepID=A0AAV2QTJ0_MEGNR
MMLNQNIYCPRCQSVNLMQAGVLISDKSNMCSDTVNIGCPFKLVTLPYLFIKKKLDTNRLIFALTKEREMNIMIIIIMIMGLNTDRRSIIIKPVDASCYQYSQEALLTNDQGL